MVLHPEPVAEVRRFLDAAGIDAVIMYDMAHVLGLVGPHFQQPFAEGADLVTGSTHKTFFGTQRGVVGSRWSEDDEKYDLWEAIERRTFPGSVSNHHLGTLLGLLMAAYEMNHFKDAYQPAVIANAKAFAGRCTTPASTSPATLASTTRRRTRSWSRWATGAGRRSPAGSRTATSSATTRRLPTRRASRPPARCVWAWPR